MVNCLYNVIILYVKGKITHNCFTIDRSVFHCNGVAGEMLGIFSNSKINACVCQSQPDISPSQVRLLFFNQSNAWIVMAWCYGIMCVMNTLGPARGVQTIKVSTGQFT